MSWVRVLLLVTGLLSLTAHAQGSINLVTDKPVGTPLVMNAGTVSSDTMIVSVNSDASDMIQGWQTSLLVIVSLGGVGTVDFNQSFQPANYVFGNRSPLYSENFSTPGSLFAFDVNSDGQNLLTSVPVPGPPGLNLNELNFSASPGASGSFGVFAVGGLGNTEWTDANLDPQLFNNLDPVFGSQTQIGEILVNPVTGAIPEPGTLVVWSLLVCVGVGYIRCRRA